MKGLNLITRKNGKRRPGVICVISGRNISSPRELYDFFKNGRINVKFNPLIKSGRAKQNLDGLGITPKEYGKFLLELWDIYNEDVRTKGELVIDIDPFMDIIGNLETEIPIGCNYSSSCRDFFISIGPQGDIYPCGRFDGIDEFNMGNVKGISIEEAINSKINKTLKRRTLETITECGKCSFGEVCNSGCMHNAYDEGDIFGKDPYCDSYKPLFVKLKRILNTEKEKIERRLRENG